MRRLRQKGIEVKEPEVFKRKWKISEGIAQKGIRIRKRDEIGYEDPGEKNFENT